MNTLGSVAGPSRQVFLSYGRADASALADRIARDLSTPTQDGAACYEVWQDRVELKPGIPWSAQITRALERADAVVAIMSPHSVRSLADGRSTEDSVCLNEIAYTLFALKKPVVPVMGLQCTPPLDIFRYHYVDFTRANDPSAYAVALSLLRDGLEAALRGETRYSPTSERLQPWDFGSYLDTKRTGFVGRDWLFAQVDDLLERQNQRAVLVVGGPGSGKSALISEYVHRNPGGRVLAYHCFQSTTRETLNPGRFVRSIAAMIASRDPDYEQRIKQAPYAELLSEARCNSDPESAFEVGVLAALRNRESPVGGRMVLVVDALDEGLRAPAGAPISVVQLLASRLQSESFPSWLGLLATSRPEKPVLDLFRSEPQVLIDERDALNLKDVSDYVCGHLGEAPLVAQFATSMKDKTWAARMISDAAQGNFLYAEQTLSALSRGLLTIDELGALPSTLAQQYSLFFDRQYGGGTAFGPLVPVLAVLVAAQAALSEADLATATSLDANTELSPRLSQLGSYVRRTGTRQPRYEIFHKSLAEWLTSSETRGGPYFIDRAQGHRLLAVAFYATFTRDRFTVSDYALSHLATHLAAAAHGAAPDQAAARLRDACRFVLDPVVQKKREQDPFGMEASLRLTLHAACKADPALALPVALRVALGTETFRAQRLDAGRVFALAREGQLAQAQQELLLYPADEPWLNAARLLIAWLAKERDPAGAEVVRAQAQTHAALDGRVNEAFGFGPADYEQLTVQPTLEDATRILRQTGGSSGEAAEAVNANMLWNQAEPPPAGEGMDAEGTRYMAEFQAPILVAFAQTSPVPGEQLLREYIALNAANAYRVYRNGSLWQILCAVSRHRDPDRVRELLQMIVGAALTGGGREFGRAAAIALQGTKALQDPPSRIDFEAQLQAELVAVSALGPERGQGDLWGDHRRTLAAMAEARSWLLGGSALELLQRALDAAPGYAGFNAMAYLTVAEAFGVCEGPQAPQIQTALHQALVCAHNVQDLVFCARSVSRVQGLSLGFWPGAPDDSLAIVDMVERFTQDPRNPEFCALHVVGDLYRHRQTANLTSILPAWLVSARSLSALARAYQWPLSEFLRVNAGISDPDAPLSDRQLVRVPDPRFCHQLSAYFAGRLLASKELTATERTARLLRLLPFASGNRTALDTLVCRLLLSRRLSDPAQLDDIADALATYPVPQANEVAGPEPLV